jgi:hypothetical protein
MMNPESTLTGSSIFGLLGRSLRPLSWECDGTTNSGRAIWTASTPVGEFHVYSSCGRATYRLPVGGEEDCSSVEDGYRVCGMEYERLVALCFE